MSFGGAHEESLPPNQDAKVRASIFTSAVIIRHGSVIGGNDIEDSRFLKQ